MLQTVFLSLGGPGGGKTRHAARVQNWLADRGLVHICMPDLVRAAIAKYRDQYPEWKEAAEKYERGWSAGRYILLLQAN